MKLLRARALGAAAALALACASPAIAAPDPIGYTAPDGVNAVAVTAANPLPTTCVTGCAGSTTGLGSFAAVPAGTTNGTALGTMPGGAVGARFYLGSSDSVTFTIGTTAPSSAPSLTFTISGASTGTGPNWDENLTGGAMVYVTATTGAPKFRWY